jgi:DnaJ-class molecular chaperone
MEQKKETPWQWTELENKIRDEGFVPCPVCHGTKQDVLTGRKVCEDCGGTKKVARYNNSVFIPCNRCDKDGTHFYAKWITCEYCKGTGLRTWVDTMIRPVPVQYAEDKEY